MDTRDQNTASPQHASQLHEELKFFAKQAERYAGGGDCAYERALERAYQALVDQRQRQLNALREAGL